MRLPDASIGLPSPSNRCSGLDGEDAAAAVDERVINVDALFVIRSASEIPTASMDDEGGGDAIRVGCSSECSDVDQSDASSDNRHHNHINHVQSMTH